MAEYPLDFLRQLTAFATPFALQTGCIDVDPNFVSSDEGCKLPYLEIPRKLNFEGLWSKKQDLES